MNLSLSNEKKKQFFILLTLTCTIVFSFMFHPFHADLLGNMESGTMTLIADMSTLYTDTFFLLLLIADLVMMAFKRKDPKWMNGGLIGLGVLIVIFFVALDLKNGKSSLIYGFIKQVAGYFGLS